MFVAKTVAQITQKIAEEKKLGKKIAFVPTMGALHAGHLSLVKKAHEVADIVVVSLFVNKVQFNDIQDYEKYPRTLEADIARLEGENVDYVFAPDEKEIYPQKNLAFKIKVAKFVDCLCGATRLGHFDGVALVVTKLFNIINCDVAIFGEKDFQQALIIKKLVHDLNFKINIVTCEIAREESGLAMSSRNQRLSDIALKKAANIYKILCEIKSEVKNGGEIVEILQKKSIELLELGFEEVDYLEIRDEENLQLITNLNDAKSARIFIAAFLNGVRLIDNLKI